MNPPPAGCGPKPEPTPTRLVPAVSSYPFADLDLARRLERIEGRANAAFVEARAQLMPAQGATWIQVAGACAMFDGVGSPLTQTFGLGMFEPTTSEAMELLESFFESRGATVDHEVSPLADTSALTLLGERGYVPIEFTSVMFRPLDRLAHTAAPGPGRVHIELVAPGCEDVWTETAARGWSEHEGVAEFMKDLGRVSVRTQGNACFLARMHGVPVAAGAVSIHEGTALLAGASTVPEARRQGAQLALLEHRLHHAVEHGCDLAVMCAQPGSASQRNAERHGFRIAYTRIKWRRRANAPTLTGA